MDAPAFVIDFLRNEEVMADLAALHEKEWRHLYSDWNAQHALEDFRRQHVDGTMPCTLVARSGTGEALGSVSLIFDDLPSHPHLNPWLASLYVRPAHRNAGVAGALVSEAEKLFVKNGWETVFLFTETGAGFFRKCGWTLHEETSANGCPVSIMRRSLA
jgi:predicted N-acetyltransferase YhbS